MATHNQNAESLDPPVEQQRDLLASAIGDALVKAGMIAPNTPLTGPQLLHFLDQLVDHYNELCRSVDVAH
ncbi:hypothetical protein [Pseudomonas shirazica]|uniref:hypothetical protein n=1 Tax=Pseudomonas shirazica TaxID=1940636 RepID=UPI001C27BCA1|nr:hypothetical protein [Pseudomonas shirazica]